MMNLTKEDFKAYHVGIGIAKRILKETAKAVLIAMENEKIWLPKSCVSIKNNYVIGIAKKMADLKGIHTYEKEQTYIPDDVKNKNAKYLIKSDWQFNLDSLLTDLQLMIWDERDGEISFPTEAYGMTFESVGDVYALKEEISGYLSKAFRGDKVTSEEYGRIKELAYARAMGRYVKCLSAGMSESEAGQEFESF